MVSEATPDRLCERRRVTVMFADISGFTSLAERTDPEVLRDLVSACFECLVPVIERYCGTLDKIIGDEIMAIFGAPVAHENDPELALRCALEMREALSAFNDVRHTGLDIHFGINTGLVVAGGVGAGGYREYSVVGDAVNVASRLADASERGEILVGPDTRRLTDHLFEFRPLGPLQVKGKAETVAAYRLLGPRPQPAGRRGLEARGIGSPLVGRDVEVALFMGSIERLLAGQGGLLSIIAEAGLGKSRLVAEVRRRTAHRELKWLEGRAQSFGQTLGYLPFLEIIQADAGIAVDDQEAERWAKLESRAKALFPEEWPDVLPYLATLLTLEVPGELAERVKYLDGEAMGRQVFRSARRYFARLAKERPLVLVFEDVHWMDHSSALLVEHLFPLVREVPLLICDVGRRDPETLLTHLPEIGSRDYPGRYTEIALQPLSPAESGDLVHNLLEMEQLPTRLRESILQKVEGNPFYIEEVVRALIDLGGLVRDRATGRWQVTERIEQIAIPDTLQAVIGARIDRLDEDVRDVLKLAAVVGRSFFYRVLQSLVGAEHELDRALAELQRLELVREKRRLPELEYIFKHALVQEAAYESILLQRRRALHRRVGDCVEALFADRLEDFYGLLAYHYSRAEEWQKAQEYLFKAGDQASRVAADAEALANYRQALAAYGRAFGDRWDPVQRAVLERNIGEALFRRGEHEQAREYLRRALDCLGSPYPTTGPGLRLAIYGQMARQVAHRLLPALFVKPVPDRPDRVAEERCRQYEMMKWIDFFAAPQAYLLDALLLINVAEESGLLPGVAQGAAGTGAMLDAIPSRRLAEWYHCYALRLADRTQHPWAVGHGHLFMGIHDRYVMGRWDSALDGFHRSAAAFWQGGYIRGWASAEVLRSDVLGQRGDFAAQLDVSREVVRVGQEAADYQSWGFGLCYLSLAQDRMGAIDDAVASLRQATDLLKRVPDHMGRVSAGGYLARCYLRQGQTARAMEVLDESRRLVLRHGLRGFICVPAWVSLAQVRLAIAENADVPQRESALRGARQACKVALEQGRLDCAHLVVAYRLQGGCEWLAGKPGGASEWWRRSTDLARALGARYELGMTYLEMGKWLREPGPLREAAAIFEEVGAQFDLARARELLEEVSKRAFAAPPAGGP